MNIATTNQAASALTDEAGETVRQGLRGPLLFPCDEGFEKATALWNGMIDKTPALVLQPTGTSDVAAAVDLARHGDSFRDGSGPGLRRRRDSRRGSRHG